MQFKGKIKAILPPREGTSQSSGKPWKSQDFVVEDDTKRYAESMVFTLFNKDFEFNVGDPVIVSFDPEAREWQGKWFNRLNAYQVVHEQSPQSPVTAPPSPNAPPQPYAPPQDNDLPF